MKATYDKDSDTVTVTLSERNILALLAQIRDPNRAAAALVRGGDPSVDEPTILVQGQPDDLHYGTREDPPGIMRVGTEKIMAEIQEELS